MSIENVILIVIYVVSLLVSRKYFQLAHYHKEGRWSHCETTSVDAALVVMPIFNTITMIVLIIGGWRHKKYSKGWEWFFKKY